MSQKTKDEIKLLLAPLNFSDIGIVPASTPKTMHHYLDWIEKGRHGDMEYLRKQSELKADPKKYFSRIHSFVVMTKNYVSHPYQNLHDHFPLKNSNVALYAQGKDYHSCFLSEMEQAIELLKVKYPGEDFKATTDSAPILERDWASQAGLGWIGKNTCLIHPKRGSLFFIGQILSTLKLDFHDYEQEKTIPNHCGHCTKCLDACPTEAIVEPYILDANRCISFLNIESKSLPPVPLREKMGNWLFGCDICQTVCPWNLKFSELKSVQNSKQEPSREEQIAELRWLLTESGNSIVKALKDTPLNRARPWALRRNAIVVAHNLKYTELTPEIEFWREDPKLQELVLWCLNSWKKTNSQA